jgi:hypothetical protein
MEAWQFSKKWLLVWLRGNFLPYFPKLPGEACGGLWHTPALVDSGTFSDASNHSANRARDQS